MQRVLYENTFYGIFVTSYLAWVSIFHGFASFETLNVAMVGLVWAYSLGFGFLLFKFSEKGMYLHEIFAKTEAARQKDNANAKTLPSPK